MLHKRTNRYTQGEEVAEAEVEAENYRILLAKDVVLVDKTGKEREKKEREKGKKRPGCVRNRP